MMRSEHLSKTWPIVTPLLYLLPFQCCEISPSISLGRSFSQHHYLWDIVNHILTTAFFIYLCCLAFTVFSGYISRASPVGPVSVLPQSAMTPFGFQPTSLPVLSLLDFSLGFFTFNSVGQFPLQ